MGGGGGNILGTVLNIASIVYPPLRPVAVVYNGISAVESGDPFRIAMAATGAYNTDFSSLADSTDLANVVSEGYGTDAWSGDGLTEADVWDAPDYFNSGDSIGGEYSFDQPPPEVYNSGGNTFGELQDIMDGNLTQSSFDQVTNYAPKVVGNDLRADYLAGPNAGNMDAALQGANQSLQDLFTGNSQVGDMSNYFDSAENSFKNLFTDRGGLQDQYQATSSLGEGTQALSNFNPEVTPFVGTNSPNAIDGGTAGNSLAGASDYTLPTNTDSYDTGTASVSTPEPAAPTQVEGLATNSQLGGSNNIDYNPDRSSFDMGEWKAPNSTQGVTGSWNSAGAQGGPTYDYANKDFWTGKNGTGMSFDPKQTDIYSNSNLANATPTDASSYTQGLEMNNLSDIWKRANTSPYGAVGQQQGMTPLGAGITGLGAVDSYMKNQEAMKFMKNQMNQAQSWQDPNRARGDFANNAWQQNMQNSMYGYGDFMQGAGRQFTEQARAAAAKSGRRGGYLNSGRMNSDLASMYAGQQQQRAQTAAQGFVQGQNPYAATAQMTPAYTSMMRNQNAPIFDAIGNVAKSSKNLENLFGE